jgi:non-specific serine/threonine protein kinase
MVTIDLARTDHSLIEVDSSYMERHLAKLIPGGFYDKASQRWYAPASYATCITLRGLFGQTLRVGNDLNAWAWQTQSERIAPAMRLRTALTTDDMDLTPKEREILLRLDEVEAADPSGRKLFAYQRADVVFMVLSGRCIVGNEPGLGKTAVAIRTLQVMATMDEANPLPALIVCPNSLKLTVWAQELALMAPELRVQVIDGTVAKRRTQLATPADVYVINYESVRLHSNLAKYGSNPMTEKEKTPKELNSMGLRTVIFDEAHRVRNIKSASSREREDGTRVTGSQATRAAWSVAHGAVYRYAMTGTPVANHLGDMWSLIHLIEPTWAGGKSKFMDLYAKTSFNQFGGMDVLGINPERQAELNRIIEPLMRRVPKSLALPQLPEKLPIQYRYTHMTPAQVKIYKQMEEKLFAELESGDLLFAKGGNHLAKLSRLCQFAAANATIDDQDKVTLTDPSGKVDDLIDLLEEMGDAPLVVAASSRQLIELAAARLGRVGITHTSITGAVDVGGRQSAVQRFQAGHVRVMLLTLGAGAEGITLTRADTMLFMQESYSTVQNRQAQDRIYRIGSEGHQSIRIIVQITPGTVEERRMELLAAKDARIEEIINDGASLRELLGRSGPC